MRLYKLALLLACLPGLARAQRNDIGLFGVGNFNPTSVVVINVNQQMISQNRSAVGGGVAYRHWMTQHYAFGAEYEQNPSDGKLTYYSTPTEFGGYTVTGIWPQMRYEALALFTERAPLTGRLSLIVQEGAGVNLTNGYSNSGWAHDAAFAQGAGIDYALSKHAALEVRGLWLETETGCYNGRSCKQTFGVITDTKIGIVFSW